MRRFLVQTILVAFLMPVSASAGVYEDMLNAVTMNDEAKVGELLQRGMDVNTSDSLGNSLLMLAAQNGDLPVLELLLRNKAKILTKNKFGDSALMLAALRGHFKATSALVAAGAEIDPVGWTPLIYAAFGGHADIVRFLVSLDLDIDARAESGMTALMAASRNGHLEIVRILLKHHADPALVDQTGLTALGIAEKSGNKEVGAELARMAGR